MKNKSKSINILPPLLLIGSLILLSSKSINAQEVEDESEFDYNNNSTKGPTKWGDIKKEWATCKLGTMQSPIDISSERVRIVCRKEKWIYNPSYATLSNRGHDIQISFVGYAGYIHINRTMYYLRSAHWHTPSEHTINGKRYDMELHLVHLSRHPNVTNKIAVIAVLYKIHKKPDKFLSKLMTKISSISDDENHKHKSLEIFVNPNEIKISSKKYYRYMGSLTVPPCTEGVIWTITKKVKTVSKDQIELLREAVHDNAQTNARPLQLKHKRHIYFYKEA